MDQNFRTTFDVLVNGLAQANQYNTVLENIALQQQRAAQTASGMSRAQTEITNTIKYFDQAGNKVVRTIATLNGQMSRMTTEVDSTQNQVNKLNQSLFNMSTVLGSVGRIAFGSLIARGVGVAMRGLEEGIRTATEFSTRIGEINTISQDIPRSTDAWTASVRGLSDAYGKGLLDVTEGMYQTISNQVAKGANATTFMNEAMKLSVIGVMSVTDSVNLLSSAVQSYGQSADKADEAAAIMFKTIELGRLRGEDMANTLGPLTAISSQLGATLEETAAALATLTRQGIKPSEAMTLLKNVMMKLVRPTDHMKEIFEQWGVTSGSAAVKAYGFVDVLRKLFDMANKTGDPMQELGEQFNRIRAVTGASALSKVFDQYESDLSKISNGADDAKRALDIMQATPGFQLTKELEQIKNIFTVDIGQTFVTTLAGVNQGWLDISDSVKGALVTLKEITEFGAFYLMASQVSSFVTWIAKADLSIKALNVSLARSPIALAALAAYAGYELTMYVGNLNTDIGTITDAMVENSRRAFANVNKEAINLSTGVGEQTKKVLDRQVTELEQFEARLRAGFNEMKNLADVQREIEKMRIDAAKETMTPAQRLKFDLDQVAKLTARGKNLYMAGDFEEALKVAKEIKQVIDQIKSNKSVPYDPTVFGMPGGTFDTGHMGGTMNTKTLAAQQMRVFDKFLRDMEAKSKEKGDFTQLSEKELEDQFKKTDKIKEGFKNIAEEIQTTTDRIKGNRQAAGEYLAQVDTVLTQIKEKVGTLDENILPPVSNKVMTLDALKEWKASIATFSELQRDLGGMSAAAKEKPMDALQAADFAAKVNMLAEVGGKLETFGIRVNALQAWPESMSNLVSGMNQAAQFFAAQTEAAKSGEETLKNWQTKIPDLTGELDKMYGKLVASESPWASFATTGQQKIQLVKDELSDMIDLMERFQNSWYNPTMIPEYGSTEERFGGLIKRFAAGGHVGSDRISAMLSAGEFVTNASATRKFLPMLTAMNSGSTRFAAGGDVTNNVGDVNVTVQGGNTSEATVRQIGNALRREIRRGNIRLN
jgi:TP901 family phage tail tape measure protein